MPKVPPVPTPLPEPLDRPWPAGAEIIRCYDSEYGSTEFNPGPSSARFRPIYDGGVIVPTIYGSNLEDGALSETVFHSVPVRVAPGRKKQMEERTLTPKLMTSIVCEHELKLIKLTGTGLGGIGVTHAELIESSSKQYAATAEWAQALYDAVPNAHGMVWRSRQNNDAEAVVIWGTRVERKHLHNHSSNPPLALAHGAGLDRVRDIATQLKIALTV